MPSPLKLNVLFLVLLTTFIVTLINAQNTPYQSVNYLGFSNTDTRKNNGITKFTDSITNQAIEQRHYKSGQIKSENYFVSNTIKRFHGKQTYWNENGIINSEIYYKNGKKHGSFITYWESGQLKRQDFYKNGLFKEGFCWNKEGVNIKHSKYRIQPEFPGGSEELANYLSKSIKYPRNSRTASIRGKVIVYFNVEKDGEISNVKIIKGVNLVLNNEAKRVVENMPNWKPGLRDGNAITSELNIPIVFLRN